MDREDQHLSIEQVDLLRKALAEPPEGVELVPEVERFRNHLASCEPCQRLFSMDTKFVGRLGSLREEARVSRSESCVSIETLYQVAAGTVDDERAEAAMKHVIECDGCSAILRLAMDELSGDLTDREVEVLNALDSGKPEWQQKLADRLTLAKSNRAPERPKNWMRPFPWNLRFGMRWAYPLAAFAVVLAGSWIIKERQSRPGYAERLLADAYSSRRTFEFRIPGAKFGAVRIVRGPTDSSFGKPQSLLEAESLIAKGVEGNPRSASWLGAQGRAELLDGKYQSAIETLGRAAELNPESTSISTDLASAYGQRGAETGQPADYAKSMEILGQVLVADPSNRVALYNRAIVAERLFLYSQAISDWEQYLRIEATGGWADDVRRRVAEVREKQHERDRKSSQKLLAPEVLIEVAGSNGDGGEAIVEEHPEEYVETALVSWLPSSIADEPRDGKSEQRNLAAVRVVAEVLKKNHGDTWLSELIATQRSSRFTRALEDLSGAIIARNSGDYHAALEFSKSATQRFESIGNLAGALRAREESLFALHLSHEGTTCLAVAGAMAGEMKSKSYRWLRAQFELERGICQMINGNYERARRAIDKSLLLASDAGYASLWLRALGVSSDLAGTIGDAKTGWQLALEGLSKYWSGSSPQMIGYNFYTDMDTAAEEDGFPHVQVAIWMEASAIIYSDPDTVLRAMAHSWMAKAAVAAGMPELAEREFRTAGLLFDAAPESRSTRNDRLEAEVALARVEVTNGNPGVALERLSRLQREISSLSNFYVAIRYYGVMGAAQLQSGKLDEADRSLRAGVALAEDSLASFSSVQEATAWQREVAEVYRNLVELELRRGDSLFALELWEWYRGAAVRTRQHNTGTNKLSGAALAEGPPLPSLRTVSESGGEFHNSTVVSFMALADRVVIWVHDDRGTYERTSRISRGSLHRLVRRFGELCARQDSDLTALRRDGRQLYDLLIGPIVDRLVPGRALTLELDEPLQQVPFEAIVDQNGEFLIDRVPISISPGIYFREFAHKHEGFSGEMSSLVVAVEGDAVSPGVGRVPLPDVQSEAEHVAARFESAHLLVGPEANVSAIRRLLPSVEVFHFAGHAVTLPVQGLVVGASDDREGNLLTVEMFDEQSLGRMQLVVLSACDTAGNGSDRLAVSDTLESALLRSGVPRIVDSRWSVDSASTAALMERFYDGLKSGDEVAVAMRIAQLDLRSQSGWNHPYFWASFRVVQSA